MSKQNLLKLNLQLQVFEKKKDKRVEGLDKKLDRAQEDISEILSEVIEHHDELGHRGIRIEEYLDFPKPQ